MGGLYGVSLGGVFFGESMFAHAPDASKVAFATLLGHLVGWGFGLVDCQTRTDHLERFGAVGGPSWAERLARGDVVDGSDPCPTPSSSRASCS